ncbi:MAG TPA: ABC transporter ATP-binding protein [Treponemataceae bacterium]|nr:ABC transporter ATP-binding protein [Treponemataceae bacterium]
MSDKSIIKFIDVSYSWPESENSKDEGSAVANPIFSSFSADIPPGFISLTGPNGSGKSTFLLLAGGRIMPDKGRIELGGHNTKILSGFWADEKGRPGKGLTSELEHKRNLVCSFLYQNMEFEIDDSDESRVGSLLEYVYENGGHIQKESSFIKRVMEAFELSGLENRKLDALSKGEIQRVLLAFSALYGSRVIMMDEPVFAMEQRQKEKALEFFKNLQKETQISLFVSLHELSLTRKYADTVMLFYPDRRIDMGTCEEVLTKEALEDAYAVPEAMLYDAEKLTRNSFLER